MNHRQKLVQRQFLNDEEKVIKRLKQVYNQSMKDINGKIAVLDSSIADLQKAYEGISDDDIGDLARAILGSKANFTPEEAKETLQSMIQSKVYQKKYQKGLQKQVGDVLDKMHQQQFKTVSDYLEQCYENGFVGTIYDLQGQGIPMCFPLDQEQMVRAVQLDSKISKGLYTRLGEDISLLKLRITAEVSRGISTGMSFQQVAQQLAGKTSIGYTNAVRIARTEGHRIQCQAGMDACYKAKDMGADVVKQWDSTLDARTRDSHVKIDGEIRELDDVFSNGLRFPGDPHGAAAEVINCRCALLQRARWAIEGGFTKMNNFTKQLETFDSPEAYGEFKTAFFSDENRKYMKYVDQMSEKYGTKNFEKVLAQMTDQEYKHYSKLLANNPIYNAKAAVQTKPQFKEFTEGDQATEFFGKKPDRALRRSNREEYDRQREAYENSMFGSWYDGLTGDEYSAIGAYSGDDYSGINGLLRNQMTEKMVNAWNATSTQTLDEKIVNITNAIDRFDLKEPIRVYRTCEEDVFENLKKQVGSIFADDGFTSTSILPAKVASGNVRMVIDVPSGQGVGAWINPLSGAEDKEWEFLLQRGTKFRIDGIEEVDGETRILMTVVGNEQKEWSFASKEKVEALWKRRGWWDDDSENQI